MTFFISTDIRDCLHDLRNDFSENVWKSEVLYFCSLNFNLKEWGNGYSNPIVDIKRNYSTIS